MKRVTYYGSMEGYYTTEAGGGVKLVPGENSYADAVAEELLRKGIVRPTLDQVLAEANPQNAENFSVTFGTPAEDSKLITEIVRVAEGRAWDEASGTWVEREEEG